MPAETDEVILGNEWLVKHNPTIDWKHQSVQIINQGKLRTIKVNPEEDTLKVNLISTAEGLQNFKIQEGDKACLISPTDVIEELDLKEKEFYDKDWEEIKDLDLLKLLKEYDDVFRDELPFGGINRANNNVEHHIILEPGAKPIQAYQYKLAPQDLKDIHETMADLLEKGHIEPSKSPWRSPLLVVLRKDGAKRRVVVDLRKVNALTKGQAYVMKDIQQLLEKIAGHEYISGFDFTQGYNQIPMAEDSKEYTAFAIPGPKGGQYHFNVMPFGLKGAPATFQQFMDDVFRPFLGEFAVVYIDDLATYSDTREEHLEHLRKILQTMRDNQIYAKKKKCFFMQRKIPYLGHYVSKEGISMDPKKIEVMKNWPEIKTLKQLRAFLGLTGFYRRFIKDYAKIALPLTKFLKKDTPIIWK